MPASDYVDEAIKVLGGENTEFYMTIKPGTQSVLLSCRYQNCKWGQYVGEMELWEFIADAREHWQVNHAR